MKNFFSVMLSLTFILSISACATDPKEEYLTPYIELFDQYVEETGIDAHIEDMEMFYEACKDISLSEHKIRLDEMFEEFKETLENTENNEPVEIFNNVTEPPSMEVGSIK